MPFYNEKAEGNPIAIKDEGITLVPNVGSIDFVGAGVTGTVLGVNVTETISGGGASGYQTIQDEGTPLTQRTTINFTGAGVTASDSGGLTLVNIPGGGGSGTVTDVSVTTANGVSGSVATSTTTPAITLTLGAITPSTVNALTLASQAVGFTVAGGTISKTLTVPLDASVSGTNTGDQTNISGNAGTVTNGVYTTGAGTVFLAPNGSAAALTSFPTLNQDTTGKSAKTDALNSATTVVNVSSAAAPTNGQVLTATSGTSATWQTPAAPGTGTVTSVSVVSAGGFTGTVATSTTTPAITLAATTQTPNDNSTNVATTAYVDNAVLGQNFKEAAKYCSTAALPTVTYSNGVSGVGATLTATGVGALSLDGSSPAVGNRVLIKNQASTLQNGIYTVTVAGSGIASFVLTRATDSDQASDWKTGDSLFITSGSTLGATTWAYNGGDAPVMGTDPLTFVQSAGQGSFSSGNGITITGNSIAIDTGVTVDKTTVQTLSNKTFVAPVLGAATATSVNALSLAALATGFTVAGGTVSKTLTVLLDASVSGTNTGDQTDISGNAATVTTNANLTGPITSVGNATSVASQTGTGTKFVVDTSPILVTPNIGVATGTSLALTTSATVGAAAGTTGSVLFKGTTSGTVTLSVADAAGTWTMKLPTSAGSNTNLLQTDGSGNTSWVAAPSGLSWGTAISGTTDPGISLTLSATSAASASALKLIADNTQSNVVALDNIQIGTSANVQGLLIQGTGSTTGGAIGTGKVHMTLWGNTATNLNKVLTVASEVAYTETLAITANGTIVVTSQTSPAASTKFHTITANNTNANNINLMNLQLGTSGKAQGLLIQGTGSTTGGGVGTGQTHLQLWANVDNSTSAVMSVGNNASYLERMQLSAEGRFVFTPPASTTSLFRILGTNLTGSANNFQIMDYQASNVQQGTTSWMFKVFPSNIGNTGATVAITVDQFTFGWGRETGNASITNNFNMFVVNRSTKKNGTGTHTESGSVLKLINVNTTTNAYTDTVDIALLMQDTNSTGNLINAQRNAVSVFKVNGYGDIITTPAVRTTGSPSAGLITGAAHTTLTLAEFNDISWNFARTVNFAAGGGTIATERTVLIQAPTYTATTNALTLTDVATVAIAGAPVASTNVTITRNHAFWVQGGVSRFDSQYYSTMFTLTDGATIALDWNSGNVQEVTLAGNRTFTFANPRSGARYVIILVQDATGSRTVTWPTIKWAGGSAPTLTTTANKKDIITIIYDGTDYLASSVLNF